jgi:hypothetical protein
MAEPARGQVRSKDCPLEKLSARKTGGGCDGRLEIIRWYAEPRGRGELPLLVAVEAA